MATTMRSSAPLAAGHQQQHRCLASGRAMLASKPTFGRAPLQAVCIGAPSAVAMRSTMRRRSSVCVSAAKGGSSAAFDPALVKTVTVQEVEALYTSLPQRGNKNHTLVVVYQGGGSQLRTLRAEVHRLAQGLAHEFSQLDIVALDCSNTMARKFSQNVLGTAGVPAFAAFPRQSRTFYKYKGSSWDAESLLKFLNLVCNQQNEALWQLDEAVKPEPSKEQPVKAAANAESIPVKAELSKAEVKPETQPVKVVVPPVAVAAKAPEASASAPAASTAAAAAEPSTAFSLPVGPVAPETAEHHLIPTYVVASAGAAALGVIAWLIARSRVEFGRNTMKPAASEPVVVVAEDASSEPDSRMRGMLADVDGAMGRMGSVLLRLLRVRIGLIISPMNTEDEPDAPAPPISTPVLAEQRAAAIRREYAQAPSPNGKPAAAPAAPAAAKKKPSVSAAEVLAMLEEEGEDVGRALDRLMAQQDSNGSNNGKYSGQK